MSKLSLEEIWDLEHKYTALAGRSVDDEIIEDGLSEVVTIGKGRTRNPQDARIDRLESGAWGRLT